MNFYKISRQFKHLLKGKIKYEKQLLIAFLMLGMNGFSVTLGGNDFSEKDRVAIGRNSKSIGVQSVAIGGGNNDGEGAEAQGHQSIAIGGNVKSIGDTSIAIGGDDLKNAANNRVSYNVYSPSNNGFTKSEATKTIEEIYKELTGSSLRPSIYQGTKTEHLGIAIGVKSVAGNLSLALGTASTASRLNTLAIGSGATANVENSVAIGGGSTTESLGTIQTNFSYNGTSFNWAGGDRVLPGDIVSFGKANFERQLKHIAPGEVSVTSTDAINGSQLYSVSKQFVDYHLATNEKIDSNIVNINKLLNNTIKLSAEDNTSTDSVNLKKDGGIEFKINGDNIISTKASGDTVTLSIKDKSITSNKLADSSVNSSKIENGSIENEDIKDGTIEGSKLKNNAINKDKLDNNLINEINGKVNASDINNDYITNKLNKGTIKSNTLNVGSNNMNRLLGAEDLYIEIKENSIGTDHIKDNSITSNKLADNSVNSSKIENGSIENEDIKDGTIEGSKLKDNSISKEKLDDTLKNEIEGKLDKTEINNKFLSDKLEKGNVVSDDLTIENGENRLLGTEELKISLKDNTIGKEKLKKELSDKIDEIDSKANKDASNLTSGDVEKWRNKLNEGYSLESPTGALVKDSDLKIALSDKITLNDLTNDNLTNKLVKGNITSTTLTLTNNEGRILGIEDLTIELKANSIGAEHIKDNSITKSKLDIELSNKIDEIGDKADKNLDNIENLTDKAKNTLIESLKGSLDAPTNKFVTDTEIKNKLDSKLDLNGANLNNDNRAGIIDKLNKDFNLDNPTGAIATDRDIKSLKDFANDGINNALGGAVNAIAMANLPQVSNIAGHRHNLAFSYGYHGNTHGFALGVSGLNEAGNFVYKLSGALNTMGNISVGVGVGYQFDRISYRKDDSTLKFNQNINQLDENVDSIKNEIKELKFELQKQKEKYDELLKKINLNWEWIL